MERRLAAILAADVVGYSRLVRADEEGTLARVKSLIGELIEPQIAAHRGRIVKLMGDGVLAEFASVVDAVRAAGAIQLAAPERNADQPADKRIEMRVGINLGDIIIDGDDIQGDGVNLAARLEPLAPPGGICISAAVHDQIRDRVDLQFEDAGPQRVKNIDRPVDTFVWPAVPADAPRQQHPPPTSLKPKVAFSPLEAVGRGEETETLATATTEAVVSVMSNQTGITLVTDPSQADYLVKGTVQARGSRYRATVQVLDRRSGEQFAADRFDGDPGDVFDAEDELAARIATTVRFALHARQSEHAGADPEPSSDTQALLSRAGSLLLNSRYGDWERGRALTELVIAREPDNFMAHAIKSLSHLVDPLCGYKEITPQDRTAAIEEARQAVRLNEQSDFASFMRAIVYLYAERDIESAVRQSERVLELNPLYPMGLFSLGLAQIHDGDAEAGIKQCKRAYEANARMPMNHSFALAIATGHFVAEQYTDSVQWARRADQHESDVPLALLILTTAAHHAGQRELAAATAARLTKLHPDISIGALHRRPFRDPETWQRYIDGLRGAGLPA